MKMTGWFLSELENEAATSRRVLAETKDLIAGYVVAEI